MLERHQLSAAFPDMDDEDFQELLASIKSHGQREPITLFENKILDGWHRYRACQQLEIGPMTTEFDGPDPVAFVIDLNLNRRHLSPSQKALAVVSCNSWMERGGVIRKYYNPPRGGFKSDPDEKPVSTEDMAKRAGVGKRTVERAKQVFTAGNGEVIEAVKNGAISLSEAIRVVDADDPSNVPPAPVKPQLKGAVDKDKYDELKAKYEALKEENESLMDHYEEVAKELSILRALKENEHYPRMREMQATIDNLTQSRDKWQLQCAEMKKQVSYWKKHADRKSA